MSQLLRFPSSVQRDPAIEVWMQEHSGELAAIAQPWFGVMRDCGDDVRELLHDGHPTACVGDVAFAYVNAFKAHVNVGAAINGVEIGRRTLKRWDEQRWFVDLPERLCRQAGVGQGDRIRVLLRRASQNLPEELIAVIERDPIARKAWARLTESRRRIIREHVLEAKNSSTRRRRAERSLAGCSEKS